VATVLTLDKDPFHGQMLAFLLRRDDHLVLSVTDPDRAYELLGINEVDLILVEPSLPRYDGYGVCKEFSQLCPHIPMVIVSERTAEDQVVSGLLAGADDYITKPYSPSVLMARVRAVLRRAQAGHRSSADQGSLSAGPISLRAQHTQAVINGVAVDLTPRELRLLQVFVANARRVLSRGQLMSLAWESGFVGTPKTVDVTVQRLRRKLDRHLPEGNPCIRTVRGFGYRLDTAINRTG